MYHIRAYATNGNGTFYGEDLAFTTLCGNYPLPFTEYFPATTIPNCWTQVDHQNNAQIWQFGVITGQSPNPNLTGNYAYLNSRAYGPGNSQNADLVSPLLDFTGYTTVNLQFNHYFLAYSGSSGTLSYSIDGGSAWTVIQAFTTTSPANPSTFNQAVNSVAGQSQVKFKWNYTGSYGYYWAIDNITITGTSTVVLNVVPANQNVGNTPGTTDFTVTSNAIWTAISDAPSWCTVTPAGTGNGTIIATYTQNNSVSPRMAHITVAASGASPQVVTVTQAGAPPLLNVTPANQDVTASAGSFNYTVISNADWTVTCNAQWCDVSIYGSGNGYLTAIYEENFSITPRVASITVTVSGIPPVTVTLTQAGAAPFLNVQPPNQNVTFEAGTTDFIVTSNSNWTATSNVSWCVPTPAGSGNSTMIAYFILNETFEERVATIQVSVSGLSLFPVTVTQDGASVSTGDLSSGSIKIYPNPAKGIFNIVPAEGSDFYMSVTVQDMNGKLICKETFKGKEVY